MFATQHIANIVSTLTPQGRSNKKTKTRFPHQNPDLLQESQPSPLSHLQNLWPTVCGTDQTHLPWKALWPLGRDFGQPPPPPPPPPLLTQHRSLVIFRCSSVNPVTPAQPKKCVWELSVNGSSRLHTPRSSTLLTQHRSRVIFRCSSLNPVTPAQPKKCAWELSANGSSDSRKVSPMD